MRARTTNIGGLNPHYPGDQWHAAISRMVIACRAYGLRAIDGPFGETKELVAGFWIFRCESLQACIDWVKRCPNPMPGESDIEIRQIFEAEDFGAEFTPELREQEDRIRARMSSENQGA